MHNLYLAIVLTCKQTTPETESLYRKVIDKMHETGLNSYFVENVPETVLNSTSTTTHPPDTN